MITAVKQIVNKHGKDIELHPNNDKSEDVVPPEPLVSEDNYEKLKLEGMRK